MKRTQFSVLLTIFLHTVLVVAKPPDWIPQEMLDMVQNDKQRCMAEHGTTQELIDKVNEGELPNDRTLTCYMFCLFDSFSLADEDGNIDVDLLVSILPENLQAPAGEVFGACNNQPGADICDKMYNIGKCAQTKRPDLWFMI
ncbi:pheromone-binding protein-related protein 6-like [Belonocnema kinseyi]|uniref:pheromone-binding protein-related protein 6-like n=1 Tax=Belonocnema kinseyi TaxID=2817044 RepID=UPI00143DF340|nr:pheromone-binding protein-related protein 6-like [Belonocnema kinseyi]